MGDDQCPRAEIPQEMLQQDLGAEVEEVGRFVQQKQIWLVQKQRRQFDPGLPSA